MFRKVVKWLVPIIAGGFVLALFVTLGYVAALLKDEPVRDRGAITQKMNENAVTGFVYFQDGTLVGELRTDEDRRMVKLADVPNHLRDAFIAIEDNQFYDHLGVDLTATVRAFGQRTLNRDVQTGGSTITQQLARRVFLSLDKSDSRKVKEIFLAFRLERMFTKDQIFTAYLNKVPFGQGANGYNLYGIKAAAKGLFNVDDLRTLHLAQAAYLAGLPQQPSNFSAFSGKGDFHEKQFARAIKRQQLVLRRMLEERFITKEAYEQALAFDIRRSLAISQKKAYTTYPYLMIEVERRAAEALALASNRNLRVDDLRKPENAELLKSARETLLQGGYKIYTTIDKTIYDNMQAIAANRTLFSPDSAQKGMEQIGAIMLNNETGAIIGMMEGRDFYKEQLNHATQAIRQPGSTMKPIAAFLPALESGAIQPASVIDDIPLILANGADNAHIPQNHDRKFHGLITARVALNQSYNIPALKIFLDQVGIDAAWTFTRKLGITTLVDADKFAQTGVIGGLTKGVTVEELTNAYAAIGNKGLFQDAYLIDRIEDTNGQLVYQHRGFSERVFSKETAFLMTDMMRTVLTEGTGASVKRDFTYYSQVGTVGKTGSTQDDADAWFVGYTPDVTLGVWAGYDQPKFKLTRGSGTQRAKKIWAQVMNRAFANRPELFVRRSFEKPEQVMKSAVSRLSGKLPSEYIVSEKYVVTDWFNKKYLPREQDRTLLPVRVISHKGELYLANSNTPKDMTSEKLFIRRQESLVDLYARLRALGKDVSGYVPLDAGKMAPSKIDPRVDDGLPPEPPTSLKLEKRGAAIEIRFKPSASRDVVGYRLYRSEQSPPDYVKIEPSISSDQPLFALDVNPPNRTTLYYAVAAVDVAGNESMSVDFQINPQSSTDRPSANSVPTP